MKEQDLGDGTINKMIGAALGVGIFTPKQLPYLAVILVFCLPFIVRNIPQGLLLFCCVYGGFWALTQSDPSVFFERFRRPKKYIAKEPLLDFSPAAIPQPVPSKRRSTTYQIKGKPKKHYHIEDKFHLLTYGQIELNGREVGFTLLRRGVQLQFIFGWEVAGHDPSMTGEQAFPILSSCVDALNGLPNDIDLKAYQDVNATCERYLRMQAQLLTSKTHDILSQELIKSRAKRAEALTQEGRLLENRLFVYAKYRVPLGGEYAVKQSWIDELLSATQPIVNAAQGKKFDSIEAWSKVIDYAYRYAYRKVNHLLTSNKGFGMRARTLTVHDLFRRDYQELHEPHKPPEPPIPEVPQYIIYNESGLQLPIINDPGTHCLGVLFKAQNGVPATPRFRRNSVYFPIKQKYAAFVRFDRIGKFPEDRGSVSRGHLRYLWNILAGNNQPFYDCRIVAEFTPDRSGFERFQLDRVISNSVKREALAAKKQTVDVVAMERRDQAIEARRLLENGNIPYWVSMGIWVYRDTLDELNQDVHDLRQNIPSSSVERVEHVLDDAWGQTQAFEWEAFLTKPNHRRQKYLDFQGLSLLPLIKNKSIDKKGMMLVTRELNTPLYIDIANRKNHTALIATSGAGKSNLILEILLEYILCGHLVVLFDFPRPDGTSTYTTLIPLLKKLGVSAAYYDVRETTVNIIELPDLRHIKSKERREIIWKHVFQSHVRLLSTIVMGTTDNSDREQTVNSLLTNCYASFHREELIKRRYELGIAGGFGSEPYQNMPILEDFVAYAEQWFMDYLQKYKGIDANVIRDTIGIILTQLQGILETSLGASINGISSFNTNVNILVIGLTDVAENLDSLIYAMSGLNVLFRGAFSSKRSLLGVDEGTILFKFKHFAKQVGTIPVHGRKWGCNFLIAAQEIKTILNSCSGNDIFTNLDNILCGYIRSSAIPEMLDSSVALREEILRPYTSESYQPSLELMQSYWYLKRGDQHIEVTHAISELLLALGVTDLDEDAARKRVMALYPEDEVKGLKEFGKLNAQAKQQGRPMSSILEDYDEAA